MFSFFRYTSFISQNPSQLQEVLEEFCKDVIQFSKQQFKTLKLSNTDGSKAYALSRFLKIESDILNFQMKLALESLKSPDSELEKPIFGQIISEVSHSNQKIIEAHLDSMKRGIEKMTLLKSIGTSVSFSFSTKKKPTNFCRPHRILSLSWHFGCCHFKILMRSCCRWGSNQLFEK